MQKPTTASNTALTPISPTTQLGTSSFFSDEDVPILQYHQAIMPWGADNNAKAKEMLQDQEGLWETAAESIDLASLRIEMGGNVQGWQESKCIGTLALINCLAYHWALCTGALIRTPDGMVPDRKAFDRWVGVEQFKFPCAVSHIAETAATHWHCNIPLENQGISKKSLKRRADDLHQMGLVDWQRVDWMSGVRRPRVWTWLDIPKLLALAEALEQRLYELISRDDECGRYPEESPGLSFLPKHQGNTTRMLFNLCFVGWGWRREGQDDMGEPATHAESEWWRRQEIADKAQGCDGYEARVEPKLRSLVRRYEYLRDRPGAQWQRIASMVWSEAVDIAQRVDRTVKDIEAMLTPPISDADMAVLPY